MGLREGLREGSLRNHVAGGFTGKFVPADELAGTLVRPLEQAPRASVAWEHGHLTGQSVGAAGSADRSSGEGDRAAADPIRATDRVVGATGAKESRVH